jgi:N-acetylglucosaminyldiphosphoundecaprenol N-acetyl-beta-D-mannosaminyltransferase
MATAAARDGRVELGELGFDRIGLAECTEWVLESAGRGSGGRLVTVNLDYLAWCERRPDFHAYCRDASLTVADGMPIVWASHLRGAPLPERVAGADLLWTISAAAATRGRSVFLAGGDEGVAERAAKVLCSQSPALRVAGCCAPAARAADRVEVGPLFDVIDSTDPDIVFVALPALKAAQVILAGESRWPRRWWITVGAALTFAVHPTERAPRWMQRLGLEWTSRLAREPRRLGRRYLLECAPTAVRLLARSAAARWQSPTSP